MKSLTSTTRLLLIISAVFGLTACGSDSDSSDNNNAADTDIPQTETPDNNSDKDTDTTPGTEEPAFEKLIVGLLPDTQGGSDASGQDHVAMIPMEKVLDHQLAAGVDIVIPVGDLTDAGSELEWQEWMSVAEKYRDQGIEFLPVMGNHEQSYAYTHNWIEAMRPFIPEDAVHMAGYEWVNYYVIRENVLIFGLAYYNLPIAIHWIENAVEENKGKFDHIVVASHDGLIGAKYGLTIEHIVEGAKDDDWVYSVADEIREYFSEHDVIYVQGHEHQYQRSLIARDTMLNTYPSGSTPSGGNYRMNVYTQIMSGNASYKGYEFRFGERELVQAIVSQKNATSGHGSDHYDVNSSLLTFDNDRVDYASYFAEHTAQSNNADQDFTPEWHLMDKFSRTKNRCETLVYPSSVPDGTRSVMVLQTSYDTDICLADDGSYAQLASGSNDTFNRTDSRTRDLEFTPGFSRAETMNDMIRLAYQWLFQVHESWSPNLNSEVRVMPNADEDNVMDVPEVTVDLKEHVTLSWTKATANTASDILIISGTQNQTGIYQGDYGEAKDIEADTGVTTLNEDNDSVAKPAVVLPASATQSWDISDAVADAYGVKFFAPAGLSADNAILAHRTAAGWEALGSAQCVVNGLWNDSYTATAPVRDAACDSETIVGYDSDANQWWAVLTADEELALISL